MFDADKTRMIGLPYGEKNYDDMLRPFSSDTGTSRTDGQTGRIAISISRVSVQTRDKNEKQEVQLSQQDRATFVSLSILLSHSRSFKMTLLRRACVRLFCMSYRFWDIQCQRMAWPWNWGVLQSHWKWRRSIDHLRLSIGRPSQSER